MWCVGVCFADGRHSYRVCDDEGEARVLAIRLRQNHPDWKVFVWEL
jgi:hypothetical protein